ncbi:glycosyltransferase [Limosilactobacillus reuteri]|uniref:glycosyltransferase n=1 Tax=Limosilactobacillus reuteri TaxID=1598 RepID=UPI001E4B9B33|nr:glycosyltransferase [Limosilactobacillus reuteri]MCC4436394.1 glycosyltransferase [Limosilactobacillus reuteri]MCC4437376.1 glycosyltransferase [Limosilactobacillus reuteri]MCC4442315.1 glycosyltransferase [Limosilactobacillus reuteri]MCC4444511.1 glycosyltransferase [Limosilactobacillus reuteri]MCC4446421.1 glycosyltransferase [Limosilactobacillus reuteri]
MNYFITSRQDLHTSAIELAQVKRLRIFDHLNVPVTIVTMLYNFDHQTVEEKLKVKGRVLNIYQFYQQLPYRDDPTVDQAIIKQALTVPGCQVKDNCALRNGKVRVRVNFRNGRLYYIDYLDQYGFTNRRDFYDQGWRTYTEYFEDKGRLIARQYYDHDGQVKIIYHYRGGEGNVPILTLIQLVDQGQEWQFDNEIEFRAHFLDELVGDNPQSSLISDRSNIALKAFTLMKKPARRYQVFHSAFTDDGQSNGPISAIYQPIATMLAKGQLSGLISATQWEAQDAAKRFQTNQSYGIPVTYLTSAELTKEIPVSQRQAGRFIAVARLSKIKQLDHIINAIVRLHQDFPQVTLDIYGYSDSWNKNQTANALKSLVKENKAESYINFVGYCNDLSTAYEHAQAEILTSYYEGFAMAVLEAQGHGCPVVSYDINYGPADIIDDQQSGKLIPPNDQEALYQQLRKLLADPDLAKKYAHHAQKAAQKYRFDHVAKKWQKLISNKEKE